MDKIVEGRLEKFFQQKCLCEQVFIKDADITIHEYIAKVEASVTSKIRIAGIRRMEQ